MQRSSLWRSIDTMFDNWYETKSEQRKPLVLRGARQVGKTHSIRALAERRKVPLIEINFERKPNFKLAFADELSPSAILPHLEVLVRTEIPAGRCILFFDEIQACPAAIQSLRFFLEDLPELHVVAAGSLLEFVLDNTPFPVGRVNYAWMFPMTFREFLHAQGHIRLSKLLPEFPTNKGAVPASATVELAHCLREYFLVGGMPEAVVSFVQFRSFEKVFRIHEELSISYLDDIRKFSRGDAQLENTRQVLASVFGFVGKQVNYTLIGHGDEIKRTKRSLDLLCQAMLIHKIRPAAPPELPLGANAVDKHFKLLFLDIGLGQHLAGVNPSEIMNSSNLNKTFDGRLAEQFVGQELLAESLLGSEGKNLYYWAREAKSSTAEVDYLIARQGKVFPLEVKTGKSGSLKSLHRYLQEYGSEGVVLQDIHVVGQQSFISFWPLYTRL
ncbi:MAG: ATP-binding protein [Candidatus Riflebacteria bacterium]|nr:ATP-binding protein [Candidatus Riflebacteria bacterium]